MISDVLQKWSVVTTIFLGAVCSQFMMAMPPYGYGPIMMQPPPPPPHIPVPVPVPVPIPIPYQEPTTTTTTTTTKPPGEQHNANEQPISIGIPIPVPHFVQFAIPGFQPPNCVSNNNGNGGQHKSCPPCPPCSCNPCTPSFFSYCSPCHQQCRCKNGQENPTPLEPRPPQPLPGPAFPMPMPMPMPMPGPPPVVIVPFPPQFSHNRPPLPPSSADCNSRHVTASCSDEEDYDSYENHSKKKRKKKKGKNKKTKYDIYRRNYGYMKRRSSDGELVKPVLTYMSKDGEIKMKRRLTKDEAHALLEDGDYQNVRVLAGDGYNNRVVIMSEPGMRGSYRRKMMLQDTQHVLGDGKKELVFRPPENGKISNLSVSFQITK